MINKRFIGLLMALIMMLTNIGAVFADDSEISKAGGGQWLADDEEVSPAAVELDLTDENGIMPLAQQDTKPMISAGEYHTAAIKSDGTVWC